MPAQASRIDGITKIRLGRMNKLKKAGIFNRLEAPLHDLESSDD